jgi:phage tail protein X
MTRIGVLLAFAVTLAAPLAAQGVNPAVTAEHASWNHGLAHYGKWVSAALAVTFTGLGAHEHAKSDEAFSQLLDICRADIASCVLGPSGSYVDPTSEQLYQTSLHYARRARLRLLAGQASLLLAAGLFLADRGGHGSGPGNIPFHISLEPRADGAQVGMRITF